MNELITFLRARLDDDERIASNASPAPWRRDYGAAFMHGLRDAEGGQVARIGIESRDVAHIVCHDPARVLADVAAKRAIVDQYERLREWRREGRNVTSGELVALLFAVATLAKAYADHPDYREDWRSSPPVAR